MLRAVARVIRSLQTTPVLIGAFFGLFLAGFGVWFSGSALGVSITPVGGGCNSSAIIYCGAVSGSTSTTETFLSRYNASPKAQNVYTGFFSGKGVSSADIAAINTTAVAGAVNKNGDVVVDGQVVATGAITAGYESMANSTKKSYGGTVYYERSPGVSISAESSPSFVVMKDGKFSFAIIGSCGNPVKATPKTPSHKIVKDVQVKGGSSWASSLSNLAPGMIVTFRVKAENTGQVTLANMVVRDKMDSGLRYVEGTFRINGSSADPGKFFGEGMPIVPVKPSYSTTFEYDAAVGQDGSETTCQSKTYTNRGYVNTPGLTEQSDSATVSQKCSPKPIYVCDSLRAEATSDRTKFRFIPSATLSNASLKAAVYTVKNASGEVVSTIRKSNLNPVDYVQSTPGTYGVSLSITVTVAGDEATTSDSCEDDFTVTPPPSAPVYECTSLVAHPVSGQKNTYRFTITYKADGGAVLNKVAMNWGDGTSTPIIPLDQLSGFDHTFPKAGPYTQTATLTFTVNGDSQTTKTTTCSSNVTVSADMCTIQGKERYPADSPDCVAPETLVNTGPGEVIGMFAATTVAGFTTYRFIWMRRFGQ